MMYWQLFIILIAIIAIAYIPLADAVKKSPYPIVPFFTNVTLGNVIFLNPLTWDDEILIHEIAHVIRGDPGENDHDEKYWEIYDALTK